jgi:hypothetical protein
MHGNSNIKKKIEHIVCAWKYNLLQQLFNYNIAMTRELFVTMGALQENKLSLQ